MPVIKSVRGLEILDSRGRPTVKAYVEFHNGITASASVPSGASTGRSEAHELRDGETRYGGLGCRKAVKNINETINSILNSKNVDNQEEIDNYLLQIDSSPNKSNLGANAILAVSLAFARAQAKHLDQPLFQYFSSLDDVLVQFMPRPTINLFSGGKHAGGQVAIQDLLIVPMQNTTSEALECAYAVYQAASELCLKKYQMRALTADEGGLAPPFESIEQMFETALLAINNAGYQPETEVKLALDVASSHFYADEQYVIDGKGLSGSQMIDLLTDWISKYAITSVEDGLAEEDWAHWTDFQAAIGSKCQVLGDDLLCTNPDRIERAVREKSANALLLKVNQIGTITEALKALKITRKAGWSITISARSGETEDDWLADLAVGWQADYIKIGSITQSERLAKYNRLLEIEQEIKLKMKNEQ